MNIRGFGEYGLRGEPKQICSECSTLPSLTSTDKSVCATPSCRSHRCCYLNDSLFHLSTLCIRRSPEQIPLSELDAEVSGGGFGRSILDAFDDDVAVELRAEGDDVSDDLQFRRIGFELRSEELADFQVRRTDLLDQRQVRVGDADVVEGEADAEGAELVDGVEKGRSLTKLLLLGYFEDDAREVDAVLPRGRRQRRDDADVVKRGGMNVEEESRRLRKRYRRAHRRCDARCFEPGHILAPRRVGEKQVGTIERLASAIARE